MQDLSTCIDLNDALVEIIDMILVQLPDSSDPGLCDLDKRLMSRLQAGMVIAETRLAIQMGKAPRRRDIWSEEGEENLGNEMAGADDQIKMESERWEIVASPQVDT